MTGISVDVSHLGKRGVFPCLCRDAECVDPQAVVFPCFEIAAVIAIARGDLELSYERAELSNLASVKGVSFIVS